MNEQDFNALLGSVQEMEKISKGKLEAAKIRHFTEPEVKAIREKVGLSQTNFAGLIGVSKRTLENWEQGRRNPTGPARALLRLLDKDPEYALRTLQS